MTASTDSSCVLVAPPASPPPRLVTCLQRGVVDYADSLKDSLKPTKRIWFVLLQVWAGLRFTVPWLKDTQETVQFELQIRR